MYFSAQYYTRNTRKSRSGLSPQRILRNTSPHSYSQSQSPHLISASIFHTLPNPIPICPWVIVNFEPWSPQSRGSKPSSTLTSPLPVQFLGTCHLPSGTWAPDPTDHSPSIPFFRNHSHSNKPCQSKSKKPSRSLKSLLSLSYHSIHLFQLLSPSRTQATSPPFSATLNRQTSFAQRFFFLSTRHNFILCTRRIRATVNNPSN